MRLLVVEDDDRGATYLVRGLCESGHVVDRTADGDTGLALAKEGIHDLAIVDRRLPVLDGIALIRALRAGGQDMPVLMLSAIAGSVDRAEGIQAGADDYLGKPYAFSELLARIEALARRADRSRTATHLAAGDLRFDPSNRRVVRGTMDVVLQHKESLLLEYLMRHAGEVVTQSMLLEAAWGYDADPDGAVIDRHIHRLRQKIDTGHPDRLIQTVHGVGYRLEGAQP